MLYQHKVNSALSRQINQQLVLRLIQGRGPISRKDIIQISGLSAAAVSGITGELIATGLVQEVGEAEADGRVGRRAILLRLNPGAGYVVGVKLAVRTISCVITDLDANVLHFSEQAWPFATEADVIPHDFPPDAMIAATIRAIETLLAVANVDRTRLLGIGVGINGIVDSEHGSAVLTPHFGWRDVLLAGPITEHFDIPVYLENDSRTLAIAEQWFGSGRGLESFVAVAVGHGIGAGVITSGQLHRGAIGGAGEFGHIIVQQYGPHCSCGKNGCLEALAAAPAIIAQVEEALDRVESSVLTSARPITLEAIVSAADAGDVLAQRVLATAGHWLGVGLATLVNILNPQLIIINGEAVRCGRWYFEPMERALRAQAFDGLANSLQIITEPGGNEVWARGAACVVLSALFTTPVRQADVDANRGPRVFAHL